MQSGAHAEVAGKLLSSAVVGLLPLLLQTLERHRQDCMG
jgi:hypothetical protein